MFRWNLMLRSRFGSHGQQSKVRRQKTVKPHLEELTPRILPSASPLPAVAVASPPPVPSMAAVVSYADVAMDQWMNLLAIVEQDLSNAFQSLGQQLAQEVSFVQQQWDRILGISPPAPTPAPNTASQQGSDNGTSQNHAFGSGSGSVATPDQPITSGQGNTKPQPVTSGSGSGIATPEASGLPGTVKGEVWLDNNGDGSIDNHELGYVGATVNLYYNDSGTWDMFATTTTTSDNPTLNYSMQITVPYPNSEFELQVVFPWSFEATIPGASQINAQGYTQPFYLSAGGTVQKTAGLRSMNVNTTTDDPYGPTQPNTVTLRDAIQTGNNGPPNPAVTFYTAPNTQLSGTITLQAALPAIATSYNIDGPGSSNLTVNGNGNAGSIFTLSAGVTSKISGLTITGGAGANGGGIDNQGNLLMLDDINLNNNQTAGNGGGIANATGAKLLLLGNVTLKNNTATQKGGGLYNSGTASMGTATFTMNKASMGGGIYNFGSVVIPAGSTVKINNNTATGQGGGGVYNWGKFQMVGGTISSNKATAVGPGVGNGGGIYQRIQKMTLTSVAIQGNSAGIGRRGGGIYVANGTLTLNSDTIGGAAQAQGNVAGVGGGVYESLGTVKMVKGAVSNNTATITGIGAGVQNGGGGMFIGGGSLTLTNVPIKNNGSRFNGGGIGIAGNATPSVKVTSGSIANNSAWNSGAGIYTMNGSLTLTDNGNPNNILFVKDNSAANQGGGLYLGNGSTTTFNGVTVSGNKANGPANGIGVYWQSVNGVGAIVNGLPGGLTDADDPGGTPKKGP